MECCEPTSCANDPECPPAKYCEEYLDDATTCAEVAGQDVMIRAVVQYLTDIGYKEASDKASEEFRPKRMDEQK